ncbi:hypothetical protein [Polyangium spumosum]|uniref:Lipoprotein n=1 Tax=Polyangium spumosum TaxID=889282 RepID=A0A6N7PZ21_9BACT|nr:hypothetical protein [Polyangium spumosum]MRG96116.1 hypothetical protein [Polyangium spumosum]
MTGRVRGAVQVATAAVAVSALGGCTFGDVPEETPSSVINWPPFADNCVPVECLFECCDGWNYSKDPILHGGVVLGTKCNEVKAKHADYAEYVALMTSEMNFCPSDFAGIESGYCHVVQPPDAVKEFTFEGQPVYSGLNFAVCPPSVPKAARPLEDKDLAPQE